MKMFTENVHNSRKGFSLHGELQCNQKLTESDEKLNLTIKKNHVQQSVAQQQKLASRNLGFIERLLKASPQPRLVEKSDHKLLYEFKYIVFEAAFLKFKYTLPVLTLIACPVTWYATDSAYAAGGVALSCITQVGIIHQMSKTVESTVGRLYINEKNSEVLVSSLDALGRRVDRIHKAEELLVCGFKSRIEETLGFMRIVATNSNISYKMNIRNCLIHDKVAFTEIFGGNIKSK